VSATSGDTPRVRLREATLKDADLLDRWWADPVYGGEFNDFGISPRVKARDAIRQNGMIGESAGALIVERVADGVPIGRVSWRSVSYGPNPESISWNIGISLIPEARYQGQGTEAQRLLALRLFATSEVNRVEAMTDVDNVAEQRALEKAGFRREGVLRQAQFRAGAWHDLVVYAVNREDTRPARVQR
jgi:RimJ/RimL family protein N-acetyltransferase